MKSLKFGVTLFIGVLVLQLKAQEYKAHSFAVGLESAFSQTTDLATGAPDPYKISTMSIGLQASYQRNYLSFFSLRYGISFMYQLPYYQNREVVDETDPQGPRTYVNSDRKWNNANIFVAPTFYYRDEGFSIFISTEIGVGYHIYRASSTTRVRRADNDWIEYTSNYRNTGKGYHVAPRAGVSFNMGRRSNSEMELSISTVQWTEGFNQVKLESYTVAGLQMAYRYNFGR